MNLTCIICSDGISANSEIYATQCGHLFHYACLVQWIERSKTCPQCRFKCTEKTVHRIYFNVANSEYTDVDTLQNKFDNLQFQLLLKEKDFKNIAEKYGKVKSQNNSLREQIIELENKLRVHDSVVYALKDQICFFKTKAKDRDKFADELAKLKMKMKQMESMDAVINGSKEEVSDIIKNATDSESLAILVTTLKKALLDAEKRRTNIENRYKFLQNDVTKYKKDIASLEMSNQELRKDLENIRKHIDEEGNEVRNRKDKKLNCSRISANHEEEEDDHVFQFKISSKYSVTSNESGMNSCTNTSTNNRIVSSKEDPTSSAAKSTMSIFKKNPIPLQKSVTSTNYLTYNGLGGQCKEDLYPISKPPSIPVKRSRTVSLTKMKQSGSIVPFKKMKF